jgi:hypothetical protein
MGRNDKSRERVVRRLVAKQGKLIRQWEERRAKAATEREGNIKVWQPEIEVEIELEEEAQSLKNLV